MGKSVAYVATAILLGIAAMLPVMVFTAEKTDQSYYAFPTGMNLRFKGDVESTQSLEKIGTATVPSSPLHIGLILVISLVFAAGLTLYFKRMVL